VLLPLQREDAKLDVAFRHVVRRQAKPLQVSVDGDVEITHLRSLSSPLEVAPGL
jgi:hypothetical protein